MSCSLKPRSIQSAVFSDGTTTNLVVPVSDAIPVAEAAKIGISLEVVALTSALTLQIAIQYSDDGVTWDSTGTTVGSTFTSTGWQYRGLTSTDDTRRWARVGVLCKNTSTSGPVQKGTVQLSLTFRA